MKTMKHVKLENNAHEITSDLGFILETEKGPKSNFLHFKVSHAIGNHVLVVFLAGLLAWFGCILGARSYLELECAWSLP